MALPLLPLALKGLAVAGSGAAGSGVGYGINKLLPEDNFFSRWWNRTETDKIKKKSESVRRSAEDSWRKTMSMFDDMGIKTDDLIDKDGQVDPEKLDEAYAQVRQKIKERGGNDLPEDASLAYLHKAYRASDPARNPPTAKTTQKAAVQGTGPQNGTSQKQSGKDPPLTRRGTKAPADPAVTPVRKPTTSGTVSVDGIPDFHQTETRGKLEAAARNKAAVLEANSNTARKDAQYAERQADANREVQAIRDAVARRSDILNRERQRNAQIDQDAERRRQERADVRFKNRTLSNREDWENLGREGGNSRDYTKAAEGETPEQLKAAQDKRNERLAALRDRIAEMTDTTLLKKGETGKWENGKMVVRDADGNVVDAKEVASRRTTGVGDDGLRYANETYANAPGRMRQAQEFKKLMESAGDNITDAQMEAIGKGLDKWQGESDAFAQRRDDAERMRTADRMRQLRKDYGMTSPSFSDDMVKAFHKESQEQERKKILQDMDVAPGQGDEAGRADRMSRYADNWEKLMQTGFDAQGAFDKAMTHKVNQEAFRQGMKSIARDDPERADKVDQLRRRFIINQAMADAGLDDKRIKAEGKSAGTSPAERLKNYSDSMSRDLPGNQGATAMAAAGSIETPNIVDAIRAKTRAQQPSESVESQIGVARQMAEEQRLTGQDTTGQSMSQSGPMSAQDIECRTRSPASPGHGTSRTTSAPPCSWSRRRFRRTSSTPRTRWATRSGAAPCPTTSWRTAPTPSPTSSMAGTGA